MFDCVWLSYLVFSLPLPWSRKADGEVVIGLQEVEGRFEAKFFCRVESESMQ